MINTLEAYTEGAYFYYASQNDDGTDFGAVLRIISTGGRIVNKNNRIQFMDSGRVLILVKVFVKSERKKRNGND